MTPPLFARSPDMTHPESGLRVWFFDATATVVSQTVGPTLTPSMARFYIDKVQGEVVRRGWAAAGMRVRYVADWSTSESYDLEARILMIGWGKAVSKTSSSLGIKLSGNASPFFRIAVSSAAGLLRLVGGKLSLLDDLHPILAELAETEGVRQVLPSPK